MYLCLLVQRIKVKFYCVRIHVHVTATFTTSESHAPGKIEAMLKITKHTTAN